MSTLLIVTGAPGVGKTTTLEQCLRRSREGVGLFDIDWLLSSASDLAGTDLRYAPDRWPAYNSVWLRVLEGVARNTTVPVLFAPLAPRDLHGLETSLTSVRWLLLDCEETVHRARLAARNWSTASIDSMIEDAEDLRDACSARVATEADPPDVVATAVLDWIQTQTR